MNRALVISVIVLVAVIMGMSAVAPMIPQAEATHADKACQVGFDKFQEGKIKQKAWDIIKTKTCHPHGS